MDEINVKQESNEENVPNVKKEKDEEEVRNLWKPVEQPNEFEETFENEEQLSGRKKTRAEARAKALDKFRRLTNEFADEAIDTDTYFKRGKKILRKLGTGRRSADRLEEPERTKFIRKVARRQKAFREEFEETRPRDLEECLIPLDRKEKKGWQYNYVLDEALIQDENKIVFRIPMVTYERLYQYQKEGVQWMNELMTDQIGGILADDMGLGKTVQACVLMRGMFLAKKAKKFLLVVPVPTFTSWQRHLKNWAPELRCRQFRGLHRIKLSAFEKTCDRGGVLLTSYETMRSSIETLNKTKFDLAVFDEGHKIKDRFSKQSRAARLLKIKRCHKIMLTGTYMQNKMSELWSLIDWCTDGKVLGSYANFNATYGKPIDDANSKDAQAVCKAIGERMRMELKDEIDPYILRRTKADVGIGTKVQKNEVVVWISLTDIQMSVYNDFLKLPTVRYELDKKACPLSSLTVLKKICDHPFILNDKAIAKIPRLQALSELIAKSTYANVINTSGKLAVLEQLLKVLKREGHRVLIFARLKKTMKMIHQILNHLNYEFLYICGEVVNEERQDLIDKFNGGKGFAFCATTGVGGLGITLTGADRVIIYDPDWNPSRDAQAVDRAYRRGQKKNVIAYRFITCETIEEKIYRRQITKRALLEKVSTKELVKNFFTKEEIKSVFQALETTEESSTQKLMIKTHPQPLKPYQELLGHYEDVEEIGLVAGLSHHDEVFKLSPEQLKEEYEEVDKVDAERVQEREAHVNAVVMGNLKKFRSEADFIRDTTGADGQQLSGRKRRRQCAEKEGWNDENFEAYTGAPPTKKQKVDKDDPEKEQQKEDWEAFTQRLDYDNEAQIEADPSPKPLARKARSKTPELGVPRKRDKPVVIDLEKEDEDLVKDENPVPSQANDENDILDDMLSFLDAEDFDVLNEAPPPLEMPPLEPEEPEEKQMESSDEESSPELPQRPSNRMEKPPEPEAVMNQLFSPFRQIDDEDLDDKPVKREVAVKKENNPPTTNKNTPSRIRDMAYSFLNDDEDVGTFSDQKFAEVLNIGITDDVDLIRLALSKRYTVQGALNWIMDNKDKERETTTSNKRKRDETARPEVKKEKETDEQTKDTPVKKEVSFAEGAFGSSLMDILNMEITTDVLLIHEALEKSNFDKGKAIQYIFDELSNPIPPAKRRKLNEEESSKEEGSKSEDKPDKASDSSSPENTGKDKSPENEPGYNPEKEARSSAQAIQEAQDGCGIQ